MISFEKIIKDIERTFNSMYVFNILVTSILIYLFFYLIFSLLKLNVFYSLIPSIFYLAVAIYRDYRKDKVRLVESRYPSLDEKLKTARDNMHKDNEVIRELKTEVAEEIRNVSLSSFVNVKKISVRMLAIIFLGFLIVFLATMNIQFLSFDNILDRSYIIVKEIGDFVPGNNTGSGDNMIDESIYGDDTLADLGEDNVELEISTSSLDVDFREVQDIQKGDFQEEIPSEIFTESTEAYQDNIPVDDLELVKEYFKNEVLE